MGNIIDFNIQVGDIAKVVGNGNPITHYLDIGTLVQIRNLYDDYAACWEFGAEKSSPMRQSISRADLEFVERLAWET